MRKQGSAFVRLRGWSARVRFFPTPPFWLYRPYTNARPSVTGISHRQLLFLFLARETCEEKHRLD
jgi:hypothetical protein